MFNFFKKKKNKETIVTRPQKDLDPASAHVKKFVRKDYIFHGTQPSIPKSERYDY